MTESEYWSCSAPENLLHLLHQPRWAPRLWLFAAGCCRRLEQLLPDSCRRLLDASERYARGQGSLEEMAGLVNPVLAAEREGQQLVNSRNMLLLQARAGRKGRSVARRLSQVRNMVSSRRCV